MKIMLLAILPKWNSLDSVREAHSDLELAGLVFFALLVIAEALAHNSKQEKRKHLFDSIGIWFFAIAILCEIAGYWYGLRNDVLSEQIIRTLDATAQKAADNSSAALNNSKEAESKSSNAVDRAGKAQEKAGAAETVAGRAVGKSEAATEAASGALSEAQQLRADLKVTEQELTDEHNKRMELEKSLTPRAPFGIEYKKHEAILPNLTGYNDIKFDVVVIHDAEAERAGGVVIGLLSAAGWIRGETSVVEYGTPDTPNDGVSVSWFLPPTCITLLFQKRKKLCEVGCDARLPAWG